MQQADTGSVVVTDDGKVVGILTERDLLRAAAGQGNPDREQVRLWMTARPDVLGPDERADAAWASLTSHHYRHLPVVEGGPLRRRRVAARPHGRGAHPARRRGERRRPGRARGRGGGRDDDRRRARQGGLLPLPAVLGGRAGRDALPRGRLASPVPRRAPRRGRLGGIRRRGAAPAHPAAGPAHGAARHRTARRTARRAAHRRLAPGGRARLAPDPRHRCRRALRPGPRALRGRADHPGRGVPAAAGPGAPRAARRPRLRRQLPVHADRRRAERPRTPGPSSST